MIPKIAFLLGAGASKPLGIPTTNEMAEEFLRITTNSDLNTISLKYPNPDIETLISIVRRITELSDNEGLALLGDKIITSPISTMISSFSETEKELAKFVREKCINPDLSRSEEIYLPLLSLGNEAIVKIFTTNYDPAIENVCKDKRIRFSDGFKYSEVHEYPTFDQSQLETENVQIFKMHGSVNWWSDQTRETIFRLKLKLDGVENVKNLMIYPAQKDDIFNYPYNILQSIFIRTLHEVNELIVIGHKFADQNIVSAIRVTLLERSNFKLTIINPEADQIRTKIFNDHPNVQAISQKVEDWIPNAIPEYKSKLLEERSRAEKDEQDKQTELRNKIIGAHETSKNYGISTGLLGIPPSVHALLGVPPSVQGLQSSVDSLQNLFGLSKFSCPQCRNEFSAVNLLGYVTCPKCNKVFNPSERSGR